MGGEGWEVRGERKSSLTDSGAGLVSGSGPHGSGIAAMRDLGESKTAIHLRQQGDVYRHIKPQAHPLQSTFISMQSLANCLCLSVPLPCTAEVKTCG